MQLFFKILVATAVATSAVVIGGYAFSVGLASGLWHAVAAGVLAFGLVMFEAALLPLAKGCRSRLGLWLCVGSLCIVAPAVLAFDLGFMASVTSDAKADREGRQGPLGQEPSRLSAVISIDLGGHLREHRALSTLWCRSAKISRVEPCTRWDALRAELAVAQSWEAHAGQPAVGDADARGALISRITGIPPAVVGDVLTLLTAIAFSLVRIVGGHLAFGQGGSPIRVEAPQVSQKQGQDGREPFEPIRAPAPLRLASVDGLVRHVEGLSPDGQWVDVTARGIGEALGANPGTVSRLLAKGETDGAIEIEKSGRRTRVRATRGT